MTSIERDVIDMEIQLRSAWLMVIKATWMADNKKPNALEASMSKVKSGDVTTMITQKVVEILVCFVQPRKEFFAEKWSRDAKITDIYEGRGRSIVSWWRVQILGIRGAEFR
ncbi:MAG: acyl-CoA dehydrogenase family protein [Anaerolineales bacterium]